MLDSMTAKTTLRRVLRHCVVATLDVLYDVLETKSRASVHRRLTEVGYTTSFSRGARYYTLADIPQYDESGLWFYKQIGFSRARTLKATIKQLVDISQGGLTYSELRAVLHVRVENALAALVKSGNIRRERIGKRSVYLSSDPECACTQGIVRKRILEAPATLGLTEGLEREILLEVIVAGGTPIPDAAIVRKRLDRRGVCVSVSQVKKVYAKFGLQPGGKKTAASPSSCLDR